MSPAPVERRVLRLNGDIADWLMKEMGRHLAEDENAKAVWLALANARSPDREPIIHYPGPNDSSSIPRVYAAADALIIAVANRELRGTLEHLADRLRSALSADRTEGDGDDISEACHECGFLLDTPNHELGCHVASGEGTAMSDSEKLVDPEPIREAAEAVLVEVIDAWEGLTFVLDQEFNCGPKDDRQADKERVERRQEWVTRFRAAFDKD